VQVAILFPQTSQIRLVDDKKYPVLHFVVLYSATHNESTPVIVPATYSKPPSHLKHPVIAEVTGVGEAIVPPSTTTVITPADYAALT